MSKIGEIDNVKKNRKNVLQKNHLGYNDLEERATSKKITEKKTHGELFIPMKKKLEKNRDFHFNVHTISLCIVLKKERKNTLPKTSVCRPKVNLLSRQPWGFRLAFGFNSLLTKHFYPGDIIINIKKVHHLTGNISSAFY